MSEIELGQGYIPGCIGRVAELHGTYYHQHWGFGVFFEARVARELAEFLQRYEATRDGFWTVSVAGRVEGAIAIDAIHADSEGAHLRWYIVSDGLHGHGVGTRLLDTALGFCRDKGYERVYLNTFEGLRAARHLYEKAGFRLVEERLGAQWGTEVTEQRFELRLPGT